ncbi:MAG: hypothetical protein BWY68_00862 [bacterium ADurb.Bin400]|nr:MAG: hypothetical protein BWY68_00862 [bacterium ADurb.Bin400]
MSLGDKQSKALKNSRNSQYIGAIIVNAILLYVAFRLPAWNIPHIADSVSVPLWILKISLVATIIGNLAFIVYDAKWFRSLVQTALNVIGVLFLIILYIIFPFDFSGVNFHQLELVVRIAIAIGVAVTAIATIVEFVKFIVSASGIRLK